jgi:hypothetical protein
MKLHHAFAVALVLASLPASRAGELPVVRNVDRQPLAAQVRRVVQTLEVLGTPLARTDRESLDAVRETPDDARAVVAIQEVLDKYCLAGLRIDSEKQLVAQAGAARPELAEQGWRVFLVKVANPHGVSGLELRAESPNALPMFRPSTGKADPQVLSVGEVGKRYLDLLMYDRQPLVRELSGLELEYRVLQVYCRDAGRREGSIGFALWKDGDKKTKQERVATSNQVQYTFESVAAVLVRLHILDDDGSPTTASLTIHDAQGRVYPSLSRRLAPDFGFHPQVYRRDGETVSLQPGAYTIRATRGPEYLVQGHQIAVPPAATHTETLRLKRWIHPAARGWYSGDHHVHAAGCAHYESPTEGVTPEDMMRHVLGEDLNVGCCLSWGPCWYHQKRYFEGKTNSLSTADNLLRYDVEVSGFPSSHCGHICLLGLHEQDYPGTKLIEDWPSWDLPILRWAKVQGAVVGFAHSGWGLDVGSTAELPNYKVPPMSGIGANEYLVDVALDACHFISTVDTPSVWELNIWYHTLNCGYRARISGETDFPCIYGERVGLGRSYVHLDGTLTFEHWIQGIKQGRSYVSDGKSHLMDFAVNGRGVGEEGSEIKLPAPGTVKVTALVAARLEPAPTEGTERIRRTPLNQQPYWDLERARIGDSRRVPVELVVNGQAVQRQEIEADGTQQPLTFDVPIEKSSWVALRIFPSSHTNPVFVLVGDAPIRASKRSAEWCLKAIDRCWAQKKPRIRAGKERQAAEAAYEAARQAYRKIAEECAAE